MGWLMDVKNVNAFRFPGSKFYLFKHKYLYNKEKTFTQSGKKSVRRKDGKPENRKSGRGCCLGNLLPDFRTISTFGLFYALQVTQPSSMVHVAPTGIASTSPPSTTFSE
jgi:hypothetical protein